MPDIPHKNNFDLLRLALAFTVCLAHLTEVSGVSAFSPFRHFFNSNLAVDGFFIVSGFLIFRSYDRSTTLRSYFNKRLRRVYPAYVTVILFAALILPNLIPSAKEVLFSPEWFRYLLCNLTFLNFLQPDLPGIFSTNPLQVINPPLWTIKVEIMFYLSVPILYFLLRRWKKPFVLILLYAASIGYSLYFIYLHNKTGQKIYLTIEKQLPGQLAFFLGGGGIYLYFSFFKKYIRLLLPLSLLVLAVQEFNFFHPLYPLTLAITVIFFALFFPYLGNWGKYGDISYGVYIFHFPILQVFIAFNLFAGHPWLTFIFFILATLLTAVCSYHLIERPFLRKSSHYRRAAEAQKTFQPYS